MNRAEFEEEGGLQIGFVFGECGCATAVLADEDTYLCAQHLLDHFMAEDAMKTLGTLGAAYVRAVIDSMATQAQRQAGGLVGH